MSMKGFNKKFATKLYTFAHLSPRRLESAHADSNYRRHLTLEAVKPPPQGGRFEIFKGLKRPL